MNIISVISVWPFFLAGITSSIIVGAFEGIRGEGGFCIQSAALGVFLLMPLGLAVGITLIIVPFLFPKENRPNAWLQALTAYEHPSASAFLLLSGLIPLFALPIVFHLSYFSFIIQTFSINCNFAESVDFKYRPISNCSCFYYISASCKSN